MHNKELVCPWVPPVLPDNVINLFMEHGKITKVSRGHISHDESVEPDPVVLVVNGVMSHAVVNDELGKPAAISLIPAGRMTGFSNFFTRIRMPTRAQTMEKSELCSVPYKKLRELILSDKEAMMDFVLYKERGNKADLYGMLAIMTLPAEERLKMLFTSVLLSIDFKFEKEVEKRSKNRLNFDYDSYALESWQKIPFVITRQNISKVSYTSGITIDRLLAEWAKEDVLKREGRHYHIKPKKLLSTYEWIVIRS